MDVSSVPINKKILVINQIYNKYFPTDVITETAKAFLNQSYKEEKVDKVLLVKLQRKFHHHVIQ